MRWMQSGLPTLGERATVRWLGSTAVEMVIHDGNAPFAGATVIIFLEARDTPWMWAIGRSRGRRDTLIIRGALRRAPAVEFEALDPASWSGRDALPRVPPKWLVRQPVSPGSIVIHYESDAELTQANTLLALAQQAGLSVRRLSVRRTEPNFQLHVALPDCRQPAHDFFDAVHNLADRALA